MQDDRALLTHTAQQAGLSLSSTQIDQLITYMQLVFQWNAVYNLTAAKTKQAFIIDHLLDSLLVHAYVQGDRIIDVGSGAGLPGIPLAIYDTHKHFTLLEPKQKRTRFLKTVVQTLGLNTVDVICARAEDHQSAQPYSTVITRAVTSLKEMLQITQHLCHPNGLFLAMKGTYPTQELSELAPAFSVKTVQRIHVPGMDKQRHVVNITFA